MTCSYVPQLKIGFAKTVTASDLNAEFDAIEAAFQCLEAALGDSEFTEDTEYIVGVVTETTLLEPSDGAVQFMTVAGDIQISLDEPTGNASRIVTLVIENGGSGRFNFPEGTAWTSSAQGDLMDGKPWEVNSGSGAYGAVVNCVWDGIGWLYMVFARHDIDQEATAKAVDIYGWR